MCKGLIQTDWLDQPISIGYGNLRHASVQIAQVYFLDSLLGRISDRFSHIFFIKDMVNPFDLLNDKNSPYRSDKDRIGALKTYLDQAKETGQPLFAHIHLMDTHGYKVKTGVSFFSKGKTQTTDWLISQATQNIDIAPTVLEYLGISKPDWMSGKRRGQQLRRPLPR